MPTDGQPPAKPTFSDVVGDLLGLTTASAVIDTRSGPVEVALADITFAKPAPPSTADELALQGIAAAGWQPAEAEWLGGWLLRANAGYTRRGNSVLPLRQPGRPLGESLDAASRWYADRGLPLLLQLPTEARRLLDAELGERGWPFEAEAAVYAIRLDQLASSASGAVVDAVIDPVPDDAWLAGYRGGAAPDDGAAELLTRHERAGFASVRRDGRTVAVGRGVVDEGWLGIAAVEVDPEYRRQGLAEAVVATLSDWGVAHGAARAYLQVETDNAPAIALYEKLGFWFHHGYHYRRQPTP